MFEVVTERFRRYLITVTAVSLFLASGGWYDAFDVARKIWFSPKSGQGASTSTPAESSYGPGINIGVVSFTLPGIPSSSLLVGKAIVSMLLAAWLERALDGYVAGQSQSRTQTAREREAAARLTAFNQLITHLVGIENIFRSGSTRTVQRMDYAQDVREAVQNSANVRIASIAGFEFIGARAKSLLFDIILTNPATSVEVVVLDPAARGDIIKERAKALKTISPDYTPEKLTGEIIKTTEAMKYLADSRSVGDGSVKYWQTNLHPAFRMVLTDTAIFVSAYQPDCHGHQAPVLKIRKTFPEQGPSGMSLYAAFAAHFENLKQKALAVISNEY